MEPQHESLVTRNLDKLVDQTFCSDSFLNIFLKENIFSSEDVEKIKLERTNNGRYAAAFKFYSVVVTKQNSYNVLLNTLKQTQQTGVAELLTTSKNRKRSPPNKFNRPPAYIQNFLSQNKRKTLVVYSIDCKITCDRICETDNTLKLITLDDTLEQKFNQEHIPVINCGINLERTLYYISNIEHKCIIVAKTPNDAKVTTGSTQLDVVKVAHDNIEWDDLASEFQTKLLNDVNKHLGLDECVCRSALEKIDNLRLLQLINEKIPTFIKDFIPSEIPYYISRQFIVRNTASETIFKKNGTDIFLFIGMNDKDFQKFTKLNITVNSSLFLEEHILDERFIVLEEFDHFEQICAQFRTRSVHLIELKDGKLIWQKSKGNITCIEQNLVDIQRQCFKNENAFLEELICGKDNSPVCIFDSPGMGKSIILAHLAHKLQKRTTNIVAFVVISEFLQQIKIYLGNMKKNTAIEFTLINYLKGNQLGAVYLQNNKHRLEELMFDGFDEIDPDDISLACSVLKCLRKLFPNTRIWVTTRSHLALELENTLETLGLNFAPFTEKDQIQFLASYWNRNEDTNKQASYLEYFAKKCITALKSSLKPEDLNIAGVPLQCQLIGNVFEEDALSFCCSSHDSLTCLPIH